MSRRDRSERLCQWISSLNDEFPLPLSISVYLVHKMEIIIRTYLLRLLWELSKIRYRKLLVHCLVQIEWQVLLLFELGVGNTGSVTTSYVALVRLTLTFCGPWFPHCEVELFQGHWLKCFQRSGKECTWCMPGIWWLDRLETVMNFGVLPNLKAIKF